MGGVVTKTVADLRRRRLQTAVLAAVLFLAAAAATLSLSILVETSEPFERAFSSANGAHLVIDYGSSVPAEALVATTTRPGVTASDGPWGLAVAALPGRIGLIGDQVISARPTPGDAIDRVVMSAGRWWQRPGEIVLDQDTAEWLGAALGQTVELYRSPTSKPGAARPSATTDPAGPLPIPPASGRGAATHVPAARLTIVGIGASVSTPDVAAWVSPTDLATLATGGPAPRSQMMYRIEPADTAADLTAAIARITEGLPAGAVAHVSTYLETEATVDEVARLYVPVLLAFSVFALLAAAFTIANVVSGIALTSYREIGVMKAIGFTPSQVSATLAAQVLAPVVVGTIAGVIVGTIGSRPTVLATARSFGLPGSFAPSPSVVAVVVLVATAVAALAVLGPATRAGRLSAIGAISRGTAPSQRPDGGRLRRLGLRLRLAIPVRLGVAAGVDHPVRAAMTLGALVVGVAAVTFAVGLDASLVRVMGQIERTAASPVRVQAEDPTADPAAITSVIAARPGTGRSVGVGQTLVTLQGLGSMPFVGYDADASWIGYELIAGRWFAGPGEAVAPSAVFARSGLDVGDTVEVADGGRSITVRLTGEILDTADEMPDHVLLRGSWADLETLDPTARPTHWEISPATGTALDAYAAQLETALDGRARVIDRTDPRLDADFLLFLSVVATMGVVLVVISIAGVFDTVLLETRQRTREMAILKAVGMTPRQVIAMVVASVVPIGLLAGVLGVPIGLLFQRVVLGYMGEVAAETRIPESTLDVFAPATILGLALSGLAIAAVGAAIPARRAAVARIAPVLQAE